MLLEERNVTTMYMLKERHTFGLIECLALPSVQHLHKLPPEIKQFIKNQPSKLNFHNWSNTDILLSIEVTSRQRGHFSLGFAAFNPSTIVTDPVLQAQMQQKIWPQVRDTASNRVSCFKEIKGTDQWLDLQRILPQKHYFQIQNFYSIVCHQKMNLKSALRGFIYVNCT